MRSAVDQSLGRIPKVRAMKLGSNNQTVVPCIICGNLESDLFCRKDGMSYRACQSCRHVFVEAMASREEVAEGYRTRDSHHSSALKEKWDYSPIKEKMVYGPLLDKIGKLTNPGRLLDIGCSNGSFVHAAKRRGWDGCGAELETNSYELARARGVKVYNAELSELAFPNDSFSAITMWQVIEHVHSPGPLIAEIARILKPGGILALSTPNVSSLGWRLLGAEWGAVEPQVHLHLFRPGGLARLVNDCGLDTRLLRTLDIQPATVRQLVRKVKRERNPRHSISVARMADSLAESRIRFIFHIRRWANVPLNALRLGEDIYGYFAKPNGP